MPIKITSKLKYITNRIRRHSAIGSVSPEVFENQFKKVI